MPNLRELLEKRIIELHSVDRVKFHLEHSNDEYWEHKKRLIELEKLLEENEE